jgi:hypothetical protein
MLGIAPFTRTHKEAAAAGIQGNEFSNQNISTPVNEILKRKVLLIPANLMHSSLAFPSTRATAKAEVKVSPAPVVSITSVAGIIGCLNPRKPSCYHLFRKQIHILAS